MVALRGGGVGVSSEWWINSMRIRFSGYDFSCKTELTPPGWLHEFIQRISSELMQSQVLIKSSVGLLLCNHHSSSCSGHQVLQNPSAGKVLISKTSLWWADRKSSNPLFMHLSIFSMKEFPKNLTGNSRRKLRKANNFLTWSQLLTAHSYWKLSQH